MIKRLRKKAVQEIMGWSASTLNERVSKGDFIKPIYEGKTPYWLSTDVESVVTKFFEPLDSQDNHPTAPS